MNPQLLPDAWKGADGRWLTFIVDNREAGLAHPECGLSIAVVYGPTRKECLRRAQIILRALQEGSEA